ncbi:lactonase family protein [Anaerocolumna aminovalerica]|uniref:lactonase family protein n=1 Tax=Anaerocolumna aminovalerica TaxID=1527 RepID=UPI000BE2C740|nr:lactonase family protein [Anaerocolumna aminovalerica]
MIIDIFVGSYAEKGTDGIYCYSLDTSNHQLKLKSKTNLVENPSYLARSSDKGAIYCVSETNRFEGQEGGGVAVLNYENEQFSLLDITATKGSAPCHVLLDERRNNLYVSNYSGGSIAMYHIEDKGKLQMCDLIKHRGWGPNKERQEAPHVHFCGFIDGKVCAVDLGIDTIKCYDIDSNFNKLVHAQDIEIYKGTGVRHFTVSNRNKDLIFAVCELSSEVVVIKKSGANFKIIQRISTLPEGITESYPAAIKQSLNGKYIFASNRGHDSIAFYELIGEKLNLVTIIESKGKNPRDFLVLKDHVIIANQGSDNIAVFTFDENTGALDFTGENVECKKPVCVIN